MYPIVVKRISTVRLTCSILVYCIFFFVGSFEKDDNFAQYSIYVVGSNTILSLSIACGMCIVHTCKRLLSKGPAHEHENVTQPPIEDLSLVELYLDNEHYHWVNTIPLPVHY
jgi:hypothetical protein